MSIVISSYEEVKDVPNNPEKYLIDVREPKEIEESGKIPSSINIPLGHVKSELALEADPLEFVKKFKLPKPTIGSCIIFHCRTGKRSQIAAQSAIEIGYRNVKNYTGSWLNWVDREGICHS